jgi:hypothetical protein
MKLGFMLVLIDCILDTLDEIRVHFQLILTIALYKNPIKTKQNKTTHWKTNKTYFMNYELICLFFKVQIKKDE